MPSVVDNSCTACALLSATESFELSTWETGLLAQNSASQQPWTRITSGTPSANTGPNGAYEGTYYLYMEASNQINKEFILNVVPILIASSDYTLSFWYHHMYGSGMGTLSIEMSDICIVGSATPTCGTDTWWTSLWSLAGQQQAGSADAWLEASVSIAPTMNSWLRVKGLSGTDYMSDMSIDAIVLSQPGDPQRSDCSAATCANGYSKYNDGFCCDDFSTVSSVNDNSCTACTGDQRSECMAASCASGHAPGTFAAGVCTSCSAPFATVPSVQLCEICTGPAASDCVAATCAPGFSTFDTTSNVCCSDFSGVPSVIDGSCTSCTGDQTTECTAAMCAAGHVPGSFASGSGVCAPCNDFASETSVDSCTACIGTEVADCTAAACAHIHGYTPGSFSSAASVCTPMANHCDANEPSVGSDMTSIAVDSCDGTSAHASCAHTCFDAGYEGGSVTCLADGSYGVVACTAKTNHCDANGPSVGSDMTSIALDGCDGTSAHASCAHTCGGWGVGGSVTCLADGSYGVVACTVCNDFSTEVSVDSCTACTGIQTTECTTATCGVGYSSFMSAGFCCHDFASEASVDSCTECTGTQATECTAAACAAGYSSFMIAGFCCDDFDSEASVDSCTTCTGDQTTECTAATCAAGHVPGSFASGSGVCAPCDDFASETSVDSCTACTGHLASGCVSATCAVGWVPGSFASSVCTTCDDTFSKVASVLSCANCTGPDPADRVNATCAVGYSPFVDGYCCSGFGSVASVADDSCTACTGERPTDCTAAKCEVGFSPYSVTHGLCCSDLSGVASVVDDSCSVCSGELTTDCSAAVCAPGYATYSDGFCCDDFATVPSVVNGSCSVCTGDQRSECLIGTCASGYTHFVSGLGFCCVDFSSTQ